MGTAGDTEPTLRIDCDECVMQHTEACRDCVVSFICRAPEGPVEMGAGDANVVRLLGAAGLVPPLRHRRRAG